MFCDPASADATKATAVILYKILQPAVNMFPDESTATALNQPEVVIIVVTIPTGEIERMRLLSATKTFPFPSTARPKGFAKIALDAAPSA